ncbi:MAG: GNAT family protein [Pseudomonadota bacterium]
MLKSPLCTVRHVTAADLPTYIALVNDMDSRGQYSNAVFQSPEAMRKEFAVNNFVTDERESYVIDDADGRIVGAISHFKSRTPLCREIGYRLFDQQLGGRGYITEATRLVCDYLFRAYHQTNRLELLMDPENPGSERIAQKCGFTYEGLMRGGFFCNGCVRDTKVYSLLRAEWAAARQG